MSDRVPTINRIATVVEPRKPYFDWARGLDNDEPGIDVMTREQLTSVYLIRESDNSERMLRRQWDWMFEEKLFSWCRDSTLWPRKRTYKVFREWFDVRLVDLVFDLADAPIVLEDLGSGR